MNIRDFTLRPGAKPMRVVNKLDFVGRLEGAAMKILRTRVRNLDAQVAKAVLKDLRHEFLAQVQSEGRRVRGTSKQDFLAELARSRDRVLEDRELARAELEKLHGRLAMLRSSSSEKPKRQPRASSARVAGHDLERRLRSLYDVSELAGRVPAQHESAILEFVTQAVGSELERRGVLPEADGEVGLLERRIGKLTESLANMESAMQKLTKLKGVDSGIASEFRNVQGLAEFEDAYEQKKELLRDIFVANQELRVALKG